MRSYKKTSYSKHSHTNEIENEVTDQSLYLNRRAFIEKSSRTIGAYSLGAMTLGSSSSLLLANSSLACENLGQLNKSQLDKGQLHNITQDKSNSLSEITRYNNYYEFSTNKEAVIHLAKVLTTEPWTLTIEGEVEKPIILDIDKILSSMPIEERIYRLRCVEGWSMVIPWSGFSLCHLLKLALPTSKAKYVEFVSLLRPEEMIGQRIDSLDWPYREALRIDEAMHPLTLIATGLYGQDLPKQNGAPLRLVVPWKYAFKSIKAITHIRLLEEQPISSWSKAASSEYGFYANVNPKVAHPRWTQRRENRIGEIKKRRTQMFNGYAEQVAHLYKGMNLEKNY
ncbi:protein-methionine-sulfoxide reductase catalytic subunit MsrP [sulfur-oxidizing endosymbiont of Gigantopelta aegis]|uniref:protein-methionine-sulfoxide reductase catalytic subunit MsrP n=1 Tax=sulfur-oxidizing endosymbiont of Gigantopelta aegis TaxID=2794934 RepID=UPI001FE69D32|nr:protein-methionine-sulfoxide reductase catalytic subunit MsrP [sulfur-oxidizing endosymbiont of Gigantopelta aegis]